MSETGMKLPGFVSGGAQKFDRSDSYDEKRYQYGGSPTGAQDAIAQNNSRQESVEARRGAQLNQAQMNQSRGQQEAGLGMQRDAYGMMREQAMGANSVAQSQAQAGMNRIAAQQQGQASSARGAAGLAMAQQQAGAATANAQQQHNADMSTLRAREITDARGQMGNAAANYSQAASGMRGQDFNAASTNAQLEMQQRGMNDQRAQQYEQLSQNVNQQQLAANLQQQGIASQSFNQQQALDRNQAKQNADVNAKWADKAMDMGAAGGGSVIGMLPKLLPLLSDISAKNPMGGGPTPMQSFGQNMASPIADILKGGNVGDALTSDAGIAGMAGMLSDITGKNPMMGGGTPMQAFGQNMGQPIADILKGGNVGDALTSDAGIAGLAGMLSDPAAKKQAYLEGRVDGASDITRQTAGAFGGKEAHAALSGQLPTVAYRYGAKPVDEAKISGAESGDVAFHPEAKGLRQNKQVDPPSAAELAERRAVEMANGADANGKTDRAGMLARLEADGAASSPAAAPKVAPGLASVLAALKAANPVGTAAASMVSDAAAKSPMGGMPGAGGGTPMQSFGANMGQPIADVIKGGNVGDALTSDAGIAGLAGMLSDKKTKEAEASAWAKSELDKLAGKAPARALSAKESEASAWAKSELAKLSGGDKAHAQTVADRASGGKAGVGEAEAWLRSELGKMPGRQAAAQNSATATNASRADDAMSEGLRTLKPYAYRYKEGFGQDTEGVNVGPMANTMAAHPVTQTAINKDPRTGLLSIDRDKALKLSLGGVGHLQKENDDLRKKLGMLERKVRK
jgi:hypothetical protein